MARQPRPLPRPQRLRALERPFAWIPCRLLTGGTLAAMSPNARQLYLFLALAADRSGLSFYSDARITKTLGFTQAELDTARTELLHRDLLARDGQDHQLLSLRDGSSSVATPTSGPTPMDSVLSRRAPQDPHAAAASPASKMPVEVRETLRAIFGDDAF